MANLEEKVEWANGVYQLETTDPVMGGPNGIDNLQAKQLANRTQYLKWFLDELANQIKIVSNSIPVVPVQSVNGKTGDIYITADDINALTRDRALNEFLPALKQFVNGQPIYEVGEQTTFRKRPKFNESELLTLNDYQNKTGYRRSADGFLYQWGEIAISKSTDNVPFRIVYPVAFNENCHYFSAVYAGDACFTVEIQRTNSFFYGAVFERVLGDIINVGKVVWFAFGR